MRWRVGDPLVAVDLTGYKLRLMIRKKVDDTVVLVNLTTENGGIIILDQSVMETRGWFQLYMSPTDTANLTFQVGVYDLEIIEPGLDVYRIAYGSVTLSKEVTR